MGILLNYHNCSETMKSVDNAVESVIVFLQHVSVRSSDAKSEIRSNSCAAMSTLFTELPTNEHKLRTIDFLNKVAKNKKGSSRLFAVECACQLSIDLIVQIDSSGDEETVAINILLQHLLAVIISRISDKVVAVRSKALFSFVQVIQEASQSDKAKALMTSILSSEDELDVVMQNGDNSRASTNNTEPNLTSSQQDPNTEFVMSGLIMKRVMDISPVS